MVRSICGTPLGLANMPVKLRKSNLIVLSVIFLCCIVVDSSAQTRIEVTGQADSPHSRNFYRYTFINERFTTPFQEVEVDESGKGIFRYHRKGSEEIALNINLSQSLISRIQTLFDMLNFLNSNEEYQHKKDFSHLGTMTISRSHNGVERNVKFNYTSNEYLNSLTELFRNIATQETRIFELETVRSTDPISTPAQLRLLESELRSKNFADPQKIIPLLQEIRLDEGVPLIARNHADRLIKMINKENRQ